MSSGVIPIYRMSDNGLVGRILWVGPFVNGSWTLWMNPQLDSVEKKRLSNQIKRFPQIRSDLHSSTFRGPDAKSYRGWRGFMGLLGAMILSLPATGLRIERSEVRWPPLVLSSQPLGIDVPAQEKQEQREHAFDNLVRGQEFISLQD